MGVEPHPCSKCHMAEHTTLEGAFSIAVHQNYIGSMEPGQTEMEKTKLGFPKIETKLSSKNCRRLPLQNRSVIHFYSGTMAMLRTVYPLTQRTG